MRMSYGWILVVISVGLQVGVTAQSSFRFTNRYLPVGLDAPVYDWNGALLSGPDWRAELYGGANPDSLSPVVQFETVVPGLREIIPFDWPGYFRATPSAALVVLDVPPYGWAWLQVRVWHAALGATYEEALAREVGGCGASALFYARGGYPGPLDPGVPAPLIGLQSFSVSRIVPEPSTWLLLAFGLGGLAWNRGRRNAALPQPERRESTPSTAATSSASSPPREAQLGEPPRMEARIGLRIPRCA